ncbi:hypothetical protein [Sphingobacterium sp. SGR-19]|uniref:hypothetical protein n=1 Tax=Sphingobacterium sp. SGR-19 TaxID=2710886 RepID=UPI0013EB294C|nr:hypothetical protein [Sphingobacterium sp. SGR-19]NGM67326.1 hypothetical protein [Sphingobacterium sp. SGR-19]
MATAGSPPHSVRLCTPFAWPLPRVQHATFCIRQAIEERRYVRVRQEPTRVVALAATSSIPNLSA